MSSECGCGVVSGQALALRILSCLELHTNVRHYNNIRELTSMSADLKIRASQRPRPTVLNFAECFQKTVEEYRESGAMRRMRDSEIIYQAVKEHNKATLVKRNHIKEMEVKALQVLCAMSNPFRRRLEYIWGVQPPAHGPVPAAMLSSKFLCQGNALEASVEENPVWNGILTPSEAKYMLWLLRVEGAFNNRVDQARKQRRSVSLSNNAAAFRDRDLDFVWKSTCLFAWAMPQAVKNLSSQGVKDCSVACNAVAHSNVPHPCSTVKTVKVLESKGPQPTTQ